MSASDLLSPRKLRGHVSLAATILEAYAQSQIQNPSTRVMNPWLKRKCVCRVRKWRFFIEEVCRPHC